MLRIFDNIELGLLPALKQTLDVSQRADFCVGYFNLRGWRLIDQSIEAWPGGIGSCCRLLVGMHQLPHDEVRSGLSLLPDDRVLAQHYGFTDEELDFIVNYDIKYRVARDEVEEGGAVG